VPQQRAQHTGSATEPFAACEPHKRLLDNLQGAQAASGSDAYAIALLVICPPACKATGFGSCPPLSCWAYSQFHTCEHMQKICLGETNICIFCKTWKCGAISMTGQVCKTPWQTAWCMWIPQAARIPKFLKGTWWFHSQGSF